jgi:NADH:ubiquinone oxidoreductase subunit E/NAD-dependent dihydropyrimidine dehydrogenase PreA subunit
MNTNPEIQKVGAALVVGGGIGGMQAALDLAESGIKVYLVDSKPSIGGVMSQLDKTFPTNDCAMCTIAPRLVGIGRHKDIDILSLSSVSNIRGEAGHFRVSVHRKARYIDESRCTGCGSCVSSCPVRFRTQLLEGKNRIHLSPEIEVAVARIIEEHRHKKGPLLLILQSLNAIYNYFPEDVLRYVSQELDIPLTQILRVATFYNAFSLKPRGKHIVNVCMGTTCYVRGSERILEKFSDVLEVPVEETTGDLQFTLKAVRCVGCCSIAPVMMIDGKAYGRLKVNDVPRIVQKYGTDGKKT